MESTDVSLLVSLDALLQEGSVSGAARRMGLSTPAMSHALARIRERLGDPILVRSGRGMLLTPQALALKPQVNQLIIEAMRVLEPKPTFVASELKRTFVVHVTDYVLTILGAAVDKILRKEAPNVCMRFVPNTADDPEFLRDRDSDLAIGIYGDLPQEMRNQQLLTDRFVCAMRIGHPAATHFSLKEFVAIPHIQVAPRSKPGGYIDDVLHEQGLSRRVARVVPYFLSALQLVAETDYLLMISERIALRFAETFKLTLLDAPLHLRPYALSLVWHPRLEGDRAHHFLRDVFLRAAKESAAERHEKARTRLSVTDPTSGQTRKRKRKNP